MFFYENFLILVDYKKLMALFEHLMTLYVLYFYEISIRDSQMSKYDTYLSLSVIDLLVTVLYNLNIDKET